MSTQEASPSTEPRAGKTVAQAWDLLAFPEDEKHFLRNIAICIVAAVLIPLPVTKYAIAAFIAVYLLRFLFSSVYFVMALYIVFLPVVELFPLSNLGVRGLNWQTLLLIVFGFFLLKPGPDDAKGPTPVRAVLLLFVGVVFLSAFRTVLSAEYGHWYVIMESKNWLFPVSLFFVSYRKFTSPEQKKFLTFCILMTTFLVALHGLHRGATAEALERHRPTGLIAGQANLFGGFLAMYLFTGLMVFLKCQLSKRSRFLLAAYGVVTFMALVFTLSRGAWLAFLVTAAIIGLRSNPKLLLIVLFVVTTYSLWVPEEAVERVDTTFLEETYAEKVPDPEDESEELELEETMEASAAVRIIQWKAFFPMLSKYFFFGSGINTYMKRFYREGFYRWPKGPHSSIIRIGVEQGAVGLLLYAFILVSIYVRAARIARRATVDFEQALGLSVAAAALCLFLLDLTGARFVNFEVMSYFWILAGMALNTRLERQPEASLEQKASGFASAPVKQRAAFVARPGLSRPAEG